MQVNESICLSCCRKGSCEQANDRRFTCNGHMTPQEQVKQKQYIDDLVFTIKTPQGARIYKKKINEYIFEPELFTGNSETHYKLGQRSIIMSELKILLEILDLDDYTDLVTYLNNIIPKEIKR